MQYQGSKQIRAPLHYLQIAYMVLQQKGVDGDKWLSKAGLTFNDVMLNQKQISMSSFIDLVSAASTLSNTPHIGLVIGQQLTLQHHGVMGLAMQNCLTLREALAVMHHYLITRTPLFMLDYGISDDIVNVTLLPQMDLDDANKLISEIIVKSTYQALMQLSESRFTIDVFFPFQAPKYQDKAASFFSGRLLYQQDRLGLRFHRSQLDTPLKSGDPQGFLAAQQFCEMEKAQLNKAVNLVEKVQGILFAANFDIPTLEDIARELSMTPRTLHRQLQKLGTQYKTLLCQVRHQKAKTGLQNGQKIESVSLQLGYQDVASFRRAFHQWQGCSPSHYKKQSATHDAAD